MMVTKHPTEEDIVHLEWLQLRKDMEEGVKEESQKEKFIRKFGENPLVPIGCLATAAALTVGLWSLKEGKTKLSQKMMRTRVAAQGFTIFALMVGVVFGFSSKPERRSRTTPRPPT